MKISRSAISLNVAGVAASVSFVTTHLGFSKERALITEEGAAAG